MAIPVSELLKTGATREALAFPVDYNDGSAVDPPASMSFEKQSAIDSFLLDEGATNFKHLQAVWDSLPQNIRHQIDINLVTGIHRPRATDTGGYSWDLKNKFYIDDGQVLINGDTGYPAVGGLGSLTIIAHQAASGDPWVQFAGIPFSGLDLKGLYVVLDTGQVTTIHDHDNDTLRLLMELSPAPTNGVTTLKVASSPGPILRNSLTDLAGSALNSVGVFAEGKVGFKDICFDPFNAVSKGVETLQDFDPGNTNVAIDHTFYFDVVGAPPATRFSLMVLTDGRWNCPHFVVRGPARANNDTRYAAYVSGSVWGQWGGCYIRGGREGILVFSGGIWSTPWLVVDELGRAADGSDDRGLILLRDGAAEIHAITFGASKTTELRNFEATTGVEDQACLALERRSVIRGTPLDSWIFKDNDANCMWLGTRTTFERDSISGGAVFTDGGGNTKYGIVIEGPYAVVDLDPSLDIAGALGELKIEGVVGTYADLPSEDTPLVTLRLNTISRG